MAGPPKDIIARDRRYHMQGSTLVGDDDPDKFMGTRFPGSTTANLAEIFKHQADCEGIRPGDRFVTDGGKTWRIVEAYEPPPNRQCFFIGKDLLLAIGDLEEIAMTVIAMKDMGLYKLPYDVVDIKFYADELLKFIDADGNESESKKFGMDAYVLMVGVGSSEPKLMLDVAGKMWCDISDYMVGREGANTHEYTSFYQDLLIVLLATKGVEKTRSRNAMAAMRIGKSRSKHVYTTSLKLRPDWHSKESVGGIPRRGMRPHLRRGHIRMQRHGPKNEAIKKVWIEPTFVNADENFVGERKAYNMSKGPHASHDHKAAAVDVPDGDPVGASVGEGHSQPMGPGSSQADAC